MQTDIIVEADLTPPIVYAGATDPKTMDMATHFSDGTMLSDMIQPMLPRTIGYVLEGLAKYGRDPVSFRVNSLCAFHIKGVPPEICAKLVECLSPAGAIHIIGKALRPRLRA